MGGESGHRHRHHSLLHIEDQGGEEGNGGESGHRHRYNSLLPVEDQRREEGNGGCEWPPPQAPQPITCIRPERRGGVCG